MSDAAWTSMGPDWLHTVLSSIGDAVIATDECARVQWLNPVAESLTGWRRDEALDRPLDEVFRIVDEQIRGPVESPVARVLRDGAVVGLTNHTILIARDGTERPIDDSAAPIQDPSGRTSGVILIFRDVTEKRRSENALRASEEWLSLAVDVGGLGLWDWDVRTGEVHWNAHHEAIFGYEPGRPARSYRDFADRVPPEDLARIEAGFQDAIRDRSRYRFEHRVVRPDGTTRWVEAHGRFHFDAAGEPVRSVGVLIDITERKRSAQEITALNRDLQRRVAEFQALLDVIPIGIAVAESPDCRRIWCNPALAGLLGMPAGSNVSLSAAPDEQPAYKVVEAGRELRPAELPLQVATARGEDVRGVKQDVLRRDGTRVSLLNYAVPLHDESGRIRGGLYAGVDITEQECTQRALRDAERRFRAVFDQQFQFMALVALDGTVSEASDICFRATGVPREDVLGRLLWETPWWDRLPEMQERWKRWFAEALGTDRRATGEVDYMMADGTVRRATVAVTGIKDDAGRVISLTVEGRDDTDRIRAEAALRDSEHRWRTMAEALPNLVWTDTPDGQCDWLSSQWGKYTGIPEEQLTGLRWLETVIHPDDRERTLACWQAACADQADYDLEYRIRRHDGQYRWFKTRGVPMRDKPGRIVYWFGTCTDIEDQKEAEAALQETDRRKDEFLATLAHELRNPLAPLRNTLQILRMPGVDPPTIDRALEMMERQLHHLVRLVDDLLDVSRVMRGKITLHRQRVELASIIAHGVETARPLIDEQGHELTVALPDGPLPLEADPVRLAQVVGNLLTNAAKYTEPRGRIELSVRRERDAAVLRVRDDGIGIAPEMLPRIFEVFVQVDHAATRSQGGLGIGLTLVKNLVEMHGGTVEARSGGLGRGSEFVLRLPLAGRAAGGQDRNGSDGPSGREDASSARRILVVDDNRDAAESLAIWLRLQGHEVRVAYSGPAALDLAADFGPHLVLLDLGMAGMDGFEVARRLRERPGAARPRLAALTGWGQQDDHRRTREAGFDHHLVKPVDPGRVEDILAELKSLGG